MKIRTRCIALTLAIASVASAQTAPATSRPRGDLRTLVVSPMAPPTPSLKYQLRPDFADQIDGNAAIHYLQAIAMLPDQKFLDSVWDADDQAADDADFVRRMDALYKETPELTKRVQPPLLETATLRTGCDWEFPARFEGFRTLLPHLSQMRGMANLLRAKFRYAVATGDYDAALHLLQVATVMADRTDDGQTFIVNNLVSVGIEAQNLEMHARLIVRPGAPNLYWALRRLPVPFGNLRGAIEAERGALLLEFPALRKARAGDELTADDWRLFVRQLAGWSRTATAQPATVQPTTSPAPSIAEDAAAGAMAMMTIVPAREYYARARGLTDEQVRKIDPLKVAAVYAFESYQRASDAMYRWFPLPYPQMLPGLKAAERELDALRQTQMTNLFLTIAPSINRVASTNARVDRTIAAMSVVEAIRAYAAGHDGQLPPTLDAITETPPPMNPVTGRPFDYAVSGDVATLSDDGKWIDFPLRYEVRLRK